MQEASSSTEFPPYVRGKDAYKWVMNETDAENGISNLGAHTRLKVAVGKLIKGERLRVGSSSLSSCNEEQSMPSFCYAGEKMKVVTIGGSITAGQGAVDAPNWPQCVRYAEG